MSSYCIVALFVVFIQILHFGLATHHQHQVQSDKQCTQPLPCHTLQYFINNSDTYFVSNTTLFFAEGEYHLNSTDLIIKNVTNFSLIGMPIVNSQNASSRSVIRCLQRHQIYFYHVVNLLIKYLKLTTCGYEAPPIKFTSDLANGVISLCSCTNVLIINVQIINPVIHGILAVNVTGKNILENFTLTVSQESPYRTFPRYGVRWRYIDDNVKDNNEDFIVKISNIMLKIEGRSTVEVESMRMKMLEFVLNHSNVLITIKNSVFSALQGIHTILKVIFNSVSHSSIHMYNCKFYFNEVKHHIHIIYNLSCGFGPLQCYPRINVTVTQTRLFSSRVIAKNPIHQSLLRLEESSQCSQFNPNIS